MRRGVFLAYLQAQCLDADFPANLLRELDRHFAQVLSAERFTHIKLIQQSKLAMKFKAETESDRQVPDHSLIEQDKVSASKARVKKAFAQYGPRDLFIERKSLVLIKLPHQLDGLRQVFFRNQPELRTYLCLLIGHGIFLIF